MATNRRYAGCPFNIIRVIGDVNLAKDTGWTAERMDRMEAQFGRLGDDQGMVFINKDCNRARVFFRAGGVRMTLICEVDANLLHSQTTQEMVVRFLIWLYDFMGNKQSRDEWKTTLEIVKAEQTTEQRHGRRTYRRGKCKTASNADNRPLDVLTGERIGPAPVIIVDITNVQKGQTKTTRKRYHTYHE